MTYATIVTLGRIKSNGKFRVCTRGVINLVGNTLYLTISQLFNQLLDGRSPAIELTASQRNQIVSFIESDTHQPTSKTGLLVDGEEVVLKLSKARVIQLQEKTELMDMMATKQNPGAPMVEVLPSMDGNAEFVAKITPAKSKPKAKKNKKAKTKENKKATTAA